MVATTMTTTAMDREMDLIEITITIIITTIIIIATKVSIQSILLPFMSCSMLSISLP